MALIKNKEIAGITANYHRIIEFSVTIDTNKTNVILATYVSKTIRDTNVRNILRTDRLTLDGIYETRDSIYTKIKESKMIQTIDVPRHLDENGDLIENTYKMIESNFYADATDDLQS